MIEKQKSIDARVLTIVGGHFVHDVYSSFVAPLLPVIIDKLSLSLTSAGSLTAFMQIPAILNVFIGHIADKVSLRYFVIFAPAVTATLMSLMGLADDYSILVIIMVLTGVSVAAFHAPAPAMIGEISGKQVGKGMSIFMAGGELARTIGPIIAVWAVSNWTLEGYYPIGVMGWFASLILFLRLKDIPARSKNGINPNSIKPYLGKIFFPLFVISLSKMFLDVCLSTYLPVYLKLGGSTLWVAGISLSIFEFAGVGGALISGTISDLVGRKPILLFVTIIPFLLMFGFINGTGWVRIITLIFLGFTMLSSTPVLLALVQDYLPENRATGNGLYMTMSFLNRSIAMFLIGLIGDRIGLRTAFIFSAIVSLASIPAILKLPDVDS